jgi:hypothetical protein
LSAPKPAHALITWKKVNLSRLIHSHCIYQKSCITFSGCPYVILHIPGIKFYYKNRESHTDLPHQQENFSTSTLQLLTFSSPTTTIPHQCKGSEENFCQSFRQWQDSNREREREQQDWNQQELWLQRHVKSLTRFMFGYLLGSVIPPLWRIQEELPHWFSLWPPGTS